MGCVTEKTLLERQATTIMELQDKIKLLEFDVGERGRMICRLRSEKKMSRRTLNNVKEALDKMRTVEDYERDIEKIRLMIRYVDEEVDDEDGEDDIYGKS